MKRKAFVAVIVLFICLFGMGSGAEDKPKRVMKFLAVMGARLFQKAESALGFAMDHRRTTSCLGGSRSAEHVHRPEVCG